MSARSAHVAMIVACALFVLPGCTDGSGAREGGTANTVSTDGSVVRVGEPAIMVNADPVSPDYGLIEVRGLDAEVLDALSRLPPGVALWPRILALRTGTGAPADSANPTVLGQHGVRSSAIRFRPRFPPVRGQSYHIRFDGAALAAHLGRGAAPAPARLDTTFIIARESGLATTRVVQVYPTAERVPVNLLRLYVEFSAPMSVGEAYERVRVVDEEGEEVIDPFLVVEQELWDPERRRLTILFDPGRIKRDLRPNEEMGLPLREGQSYTLVIDSAWSDATGRSLAAPFQKRFSVVAADRASPRVADWAVMAPAAGTRDALTITFPESLDRALLGRLLTVRDARDEIVNGTVAIEQGETRWTFTPDSPWPAGEFVTEIGTDLEDLAGNNLRHLFDVDRNAPRPAAETSAVVRLPWQTL